MSATKTNVSVERFYGLPHCTTCQKAEAYLTNELGIKVKKSIDVKTTKVPKNEIEELVKGIGGAEKLFSKRAMKYRGWGLHEKTLSETDMLNYMDEEYTFIKRPTIVLNDGRVLAGFSKKQYDALVK